MKEINMTPYRFLYFWNSIMTDCIIRAENQEQAERIFRKRKGDRKILGIRKLTEEQVRYLRG